MKYIEIFKTLSKDPIAQLFHFYIYKTYCKNTVSHHLSNDYIKDSISFQQKINTLFNHILFNIDNYINNPEPYLKYIKESLFLNLTEEDFTKNFKTNLTSINLDINWLNFLFEGQEFTCCLNEFKKLNSLESFIPPHIKSSTYINNDVFNFKGYEMCKQFGLSAIISPKTLQSENFFLNLEKNIQYLSSLIGISSQSFGNLNTIILIDDKKDFINKQNANFSVNYIDNNMRILKFTSKSFQHNNLTTIFINEVNDVIQKLNISNKLKM